MSDSISRADAICEVLVNDGIDNIVDRINALPSADAEQTDCTEFVNWLTEVVMDDEDWELNAVAYGEVICRKLVKLGVLEVTEEPSYYIRPSADAVEVVRCKDCKHHEKFCFDDSKLLCWVHDIDIVVSPTDYCSYAERRAESEVKE